MMKKLKELKGFLKEWLKEHLKVLWLDWETERRVKAYQDNFNLYWYDLDRKNNAPDERIPFYTVTENNSKVSSLFMAISAALSAILGIAQLVSGELKGLILIGLFVITFIAAIIMSYPNGYWPYKRRYHNVRALRFFTEKAMYRFEANYKTLEALVAPYKKKQADEKAAQEAEKEAQKQVELAKEENRRQKARAEFYPQFLVLLSYVEANFKVSTPNPDCVEGKFTIVLPNPNAIGKSEWSFDFTKDELDRLVVMISNMEDAILRRISLYEMIAENASAFANLVNPNYPSSETE